MRPTLAARLASMALSVFGKKPVETAEADNQETTQVQVEVAEEKKPVPVVSAKPWFSYADMVKRRKTRNMRLPKQQQVDIMAMAEAKRMTRRLRPMGSSS